MPSIRVKRGTVAQIEAAASGSGLLSGEVYLVTDQSRLAVATSPSAYEAMAKLSEADGWNYAKLASDFTTGSATAVNVTGLSFTPGASQTIEFEALLLVRTATTTVGPRPGLAWASGLTDGVANLWVPTSGTAFAQVFGNFNATLLGAVGGLPNTTQSYPARIAGMVIAGGSPSGTVRVQLASETAATNVTAKAGSFLRWRTLP